MPTTYSSIRDLKIAMRIARQFEEICARLTANGACIHAATKKGRGDGCPAARGRNSPARIGYERSVDEGLALVAMLPTVTRERAVGRRSHRSPRPSKRSPRGRSRRSRPCIRRIPTWPRARSPLYPWRPQSMPIVTSDVLVFLTVTAVAAPAMSMAAAANVRVLNDLHLLPPVGLKDGPSCRGLVTTIVLL